MVGSYDRLTNDLQRSRIRLNDELLFAPQKYGDKYYVHIEIPSASRYFRINYEEYVFVSLFDGQTSLAHAQAVVAQSLGSRAPSEEKCTQLVRWLLENGLAFLADSRAPELAKQSKQPKLKLYQKLNPFWMKFSLGNPDKYLDGMLRYTALLFHPFVLLLSLLTMIGAIVVGCTNVERIANSSSNLLAPTNWLPMLVVWILLKFVHEIAHGLTCRKFGGAVRDTGVILILFAPMAYVDVTASWRFKSRWQRIMVAGAGIYVELCISAVCLFVWFLTSSPILKQQLVNVIVMTSVATILFNANPLMRFDGYFILSDLLKIPNLHTSGSNALRRHLQWLFFGQCEQKSCIEIPRNTRIVTVYGYAAAIWKVMICAGLAIAASMMFHGLGIVIAVLGLVSWCAKPAWELIKNINRRRISHPHTLLRALTVAVIISVFLAGTWTTIPNPFSARCPCIVDFEDAAKIRAKTSGFIAAVLVDDGQFVASGTPLLRLENAELESEIVELRARHQQHLTHERIAIDNHKAADAQVAARDAAATEKALRQRENEANALVLRATRDGHVVSSKLAELVGQYVQRGDHLLSIGGDGSKEVVLSIAPGDIRITAKLVGRQIPIEIGSRRRMIATIYRIDPKASQQVRQPKLISINGGPLAVKLADSTEHSDRSSYELKEPHFQAFAKLEPRDACLLFSGERGFAALNSSHDTLGKLVVDRIQDWINNQIKLAAGNSG